MKYLLIIATILSYQSISAQEAYNQEIAQWQEALDASFADKESSPLTAKERKKFKGLAYYPVNAALRFEARLERRYNEQPFSIPTSANKKKVFVRYAIAHFTYGAQDYQFPVYQSLQLQQTNESDYLFAPFTDLTSGFDSYGGGRYLDLKIPEGDTIIIDFNKAYNPSCAYSPYFNCPIPPRENDLDLEVKAGVKSWENGKH